jgi:lysine-specific demethylase 3
LFSKAEKLQQTPVYQQSPIVTFSSNEIKVEMGSDSAKFLLIDSKPELISKEELDFKIFKIFDKEWHRKESGKRKPILIKNVDKRMKIDLWSSNWFKLKFSGKNDINVDLINCENGKEIPNASMSFFWEGFDDTCKDVFFDEKSKVINTLKLKDWPTSNDFKVVLQDHYNDLMENMPVKEYCHRYGIFNLAAKVPERFLKPDLGPKLYIAYSSQDSPQAGTTNLHIDISDAFNVLLYVGEKNLKKDKKKKEDATVSYFRKSGISEDQINRYLLGEKPGAIWHVFKPIDADKIRKAILDERSVKNRKGDPIHDQQTYLDDKLLNKLKTKFKVTPYTIFQFLGDAIFVPAGAPHQVIIQNGFKTASEYKPIM